jgi:hypothetical protein
MKLDLKALLKPKGSTVIIFSILFIVINFLMNQVRVADGVNYLRLPFPVKVTQCAWGRSITGGMAANNCHDQMIVWWGILACILFWAAIYLVLSAWKNRKLIRSSSENPSLKGTEDFEDKK